MPLPSILHVPLALPVLCAPLFIVSGPRLVVAQCKAGVIGTMPSLSIRPKEALEPALVAIREELEAFREANPDRPVGPFGINLIAHHSNERLAHDLDVCVRQQVPLIITSLGPSRAIVERVHAYGGAVFHDVTNLRHARKAIDQGVDGLIAVAAGAGGHAGTIHPFALIAELREIFDGTLVLSGAISSGREVAAARAIGADLAYVGTRFIATHEADAVPAYQQMVLESNAEDICYTSYFSGVRGNYLRECIRANGLDPDNLPAREAGTMKVSESGSKGKAWKDIWSAGQGVGSIRDVPSVAELVDRMRAEFDVACRGLAAPVAGAI